MAFKFKRKETVREAVARLAKDCVETALTEAQKDEFEAIHCARKQIKKMRTLLRLVRTEIGDRDFKRRKKRLREAADYLAPARDAYIQTQTFEHLMQRQKNVRAPRFAAALKQECRVQMQQFCRNDLWKEVRAVLKTEVRCFAKLRLKHRGWAAIQPGLKKSYKAAQKAHDVARTEPTPAHLHEWRKRVKDLWYNVSLLDAIFPEQTTAQELEQLADILGNHHDLHVLREAAVKKSVKADFVANTEALLPVIDARDRELRSRAIKMGERLLPEKPSDFCTRLHRYWKMWKRKKLRGRAWMISL
jgi:hypothetical protein